MILLGAGASATFGIPTTIEMATKFGQRLEGEEKNLFDLIASKLKNYRIFDVEAYRIHKRTSRPFRRNI